MTGDDTDLRVLHVLDHSIPLHSGYTFRTLSLLAGQHRRGWQTFHLTSPKHRGATAPVEEIDGWRFHRTAPGPLADVPVLGELSLMWALARRLDAVAAEIRPTLLHAHSPVLNALPALWVGRRRRLPVIYEIRAFWEDAAVNLGSCREGDARYRATRALETFAVRRADAVAVICDGLRRDLIGRGIDADKIVVIPNGVDPAEFPLIAGRDPALSARLGLDGAFVLGFLGSFYDYEGLDLLLDALPALRARIPELRVLLVGGGPMAAALEAQAARLGVADIVRFTGRVPHDEVQGYYSLVDLLVFPRRSIRLTELVTPLKPLEAMAQGRLVAASDIGGHRELIRDGETGYLFPPDDPGALVAAIERIRADRDRWDERRATARRFVETERTWDHSVAGYQEVYRRLAERSRA